MSAENISYDLKRFAGIKRDYTTEDVEKLRGLLNLSGLDDIYFLTLLLLIIGIIIFFLLFITLKNNKIEV